MSAAKIVILGASGFVGTTLTECLLSRPNTEIVPVIHSAGSAWRLARRNIPLAQVDIMDFAALKRVLQRATHVVNCTRGARSTMLDGLEKILLAAREVGVQRLVHLSSVMVYGDPPHVDSHHEDASTAPPPGTDSYGFIKLEQDRMVEVAAKAGLPAVVLCPPNISGPFSGYVVGILNGLRTGSFALLDEGTGPCNLVDVRNLCHAIELAIDVQGIEFDGQRMFVTDGDVISWKDVVGELLPLAGAETVRRISRPALIRLAGGGAQPRKSGMLRSLRHLVSSDVRGALRKDPKLQKLDLMMRAGVAKLGPRIENRLRLSIDGPPPVSHPDPYANLAVGLCAQQLREVRHANDRIARVLRYSPLINFNTSMADFRAWYRNMHGMSGQYWSISRHLYE